MELPNDANTIIKGIGMRWYHKLEENDDSPNSVEYSVTDKRENPIPALLELAHWGNRSR